MFRIVFDQLERLNQACYGNWIRFNRATPQERISFTELKMVEEFKTRHKFSNLFNKSAQQTINPDELPETRILVGSERTNAGFEVVSESRQPIFDYSSSDGQNASLHATVEHTEKNSGIRFARTVFLQTLVKDERYMEGIWFSDEAD